MTTNFRQGTELMSVQVVDFDPTIGLGVSGGTPFLFLIRTDTPGLYYFNGPLDTDWVLIGSGVAPVSTGQVLQYTATGAEGDDFVIDLVTDCGGVDQPDTLFNAIVTGGGLADQLTFDVQYVDNTIHSIHVLSSAALTADDVLMITITEITS
jgi:hypothetical protein